MSGTQRIGGPVEIQAGGIRLKVKPGATYNLGHPKREGVLGAKDAHGYKEAPQMAFVEAEVTDHRTLDVKALTTMEDATVTVTAPNGKTILFHNAYYAGEGTVSTDEGSLTIRFESTRPAEEI